MSLSVENISENLQSQERRPKIETFKYLQEECKNKENVLNVIGKIFDDCYLYILNCYGDKYENVREHAIATINAFMERLPPNDFHLNNILSTLVARMGLQETVEDSEEIRLLYVGQLHRLIKTYPINSIQECYPEIVRILVKGLKDDYPAVQREACACVSNLSRKADTYAFQPWSNHLAKAAYGMLNHKHCLARIAAINAIGRLSLHVNPKEDALSKLIMEVSPLLMDNMPLVRRECGEIGILMLLELVDRYSYFERIIPLVLCCLKDDSAEVRDYIQPLWEKCGKLYYEENEKELSQQELADLPAKNYPEGVNRPTIGCRGLVQRSLRLLKLITRESTDWKDNVRIHSLKLLYQFVLHAEAAMTAKFFEIYPDVARACQDGEIEVIEEANKVADLMGRLLSYEDWCNHGFDGLAKNAREGYLRCFYYMFTSAVDVKLSDLVRLIEILVESEFSQSLKASFQMYVIKLVETILDKCKHITWKEDNSKAGGDQAFELNNQFYENMYITVIKPMAICYTLETEMYRKESQYVLENKVLEEIANRQNIEIGQLHEKYFAAALEHVNNLEVPLDALSEPILLLHGLIRICGLRSTYIMELKEVLNKVFENCADDAKVKIFTVTSTSILSWNKTINRPIEESADILSKFIASVIEPHLTWRVGASAEAMRSIATASLCSVSTGAPEEAKRVLPSLVKYILNLLEDRVVSTRFCAVKTLFNCGDLKIEILRNIAYAVLQRLDDPSPNIRELAVLLLPKLYPKFEKNEFGEENEFDHNIWNKFISQTIDLLILHYNGPEKKIKHCIKESLLNLASLYSEIFKECFHRNLAVSHQGSPLFDLKNELPFSI